MELLAILIFILVVVLAPFLFIAWVIYAFVRAAVASPHARHERLALNRTGDALASG